MKMSKLILFLQVEVSFIYTITKMIYRKKYIH